VTTLAMQAWIALGAMANPVTQKTEKNPEQAKLIIDTLEMLQEKTKGNLTAEESKFLEDVLYELRMGFINHEQKINL
jgi:1,4-alpha-glucan branching enzyme